eukprot:365471-Chlamydomonas_euryale.AAC.14
MQATNTVNSKLTDSTSGGQQSSAAKATPLQAVQPSQACAPLRTARSEQERQEQQCKRIATAAQANTKCQRAALRGASGATRGGRGGGRRSGGGRGRVSAANQ